MTFRQWLLSQTARTDGVGILAGWVRDNPPDIVRWTGKDMARHILYGPAFLAGGVELLSRALHEFRASERARKAAK